MKKILPLLLLSASLLMVNGCAVNRATASLTPGTELTNVRTFYVVSQSADKHGVDKLIQNQLVKMGYSAKTGPEKTGGYATDAIVTYSDKWMWDITMYMIELTITLRQPDNNFPLATGNSMHTSLTRKSPEEMVEEVLTNIFTASKK